jgi:hypothetical protein
VPIDKRQIPVRAKKNGAGSGEPAPNLAALRALKVDVPAANLSQLVI